jgi:predicted ATP-dependent endonuclease of OLD family
MKLKKVEIHHYKSFENRQEFEIEDDVTILVGMNESGKTAALEVLAKTNYFQVDDKFKFNLTLDYPRKEKKSIDKSGDNPKAITCTYEISDDLLKEIENDVGKNILKSKLFSVSSNYKNAPDTWDIIETDVKKFVENKAKILGVSSVSYNEKLVSAKNLEQLSELKSSYSDKKYVDSFVAYEPYFQNLWNWDNPISEYIARCYLLPNKPKFLYYDEYFSLPSRISIEKLNNKKLHEDEEKTAKALVELADINISELLKTSDFENFIAEIEATEAIISTELFKYWKTNTNLKIEFELDKIEGTDTNNNTTIVEHILDIRVKSKGVSLPLKNRSKGFNWFFSFLVWFKKIQEDTNSKYILLLDEPGLNLHASAQKDLMNFIEDLSKNYQIVYTTHSPFMIPNGKLNRIRTILETEDGSVISDSIQEKDPNTLFPLQAALGYDIAQNLFVSQKNLLVEGVSDLIILTALSGILESECRIGLRSDLTIVPTGGLEKVATFISLLRGSQLEIVCLLDSISDDKVKSNMNKMISEKIIHKNKIRFYDEFLESSNNADLEDLFSKVEYLKLFNSAFTEYSDISLSDLNPKIPKILLQINNHIKKDRFNHYRPANALVKLGISKDFFSDVTLTNFENVFKEINRLFD